MRFHKVAALVAASLSLCSVASAAPLITAFIGTPSPTSRQAFFVLDFNDSGANPETYAFGYNYEGSKTAQDFVLALADSVTGVPGFVQTGATNNFVTRFGYNGREKFNDFAGNNSGDPNGYWNLWLGFDGATWTNAQFGIADIALSDTPQFSTNPFSGTSELSSAKWTGFRWTVGTAAAPRTPQIAVAVPESGTLLLAIIGAAGTGTLIVRRRTR